MGIELCGLGLVLDGVFEIALAEIDVGKGVVVAAFPRAATPATSAST